MARKFAEAGANVSLVARSTAAMESVVADIGGQAVTADLLDPAQVDGLVPKIESEVGPIDILVNNAGLETQRFFNDLDPQTIRDVIQLNLEAPLVLTRAVLDSMLERNFGHLVFTASVAGTSGFPGLAAYGASKAGLMNFVAALRMELRDTDIGTTIVAPGPVDTEMWAQLENNDEFAPMLKRLRRLQMLPMQTAEAVAEQTVAGVKADRRHVRSPRRLLLNHTLREAPTRMVETLLRGVPIGPQRN